MDKTNENQPHTNDFIQPEFIYAVVGASKDKTKYGHRVYKDLLEAGYKAFPVNPKGGELLGHKVYRNLRDIPAQADVLVMVVPPQVSLKILIQAKALGIDKIWFQPGSEDEEALEFCKDQGLECLTQTCIMMERR